MRSHRFPRGFPWNGGARKRKAELGNSLADFSYEAMQEQLKHEGSQNPEHLGRTKRQRVRGHWPGSMWQWDEHEELTQEQKVRTAAFHQQVFGTESPKPTRFLMRMIGMALRDFPKKDGMRVLWRRSRPPLIGQSNGTFNTAASAAWPPDLCKWVYAFQKNSAQKTEPRGGSSEGGGSRPYLAIGPATPCKWRRDDFSWWRLLEFAWEVALGYEEILGGKMDRAEERA